MLSLRYAAVCQARAEETILDNSRQQLRSRIAWWKDRSGLDDVDWNRCQGSRSASRIQSFHGSFDTRLLNRYRTKLDGCSRNSAIKGRLQEMWSSWVRSSVQRSSKIAGVLEHGSAKRSGRTKISSKTPYGVHVARSILRRRVQRRWNSKSSKNWLAPHDVK